VIYIGQKLVFHTNRKGETMRVSVLTAVSVFALLLPGVVYAADMLPVGKYEVNHTSKGDRLPLPETKSEAPMPLPTTESVTPKPFVAPEKPTPWNWRKDV
jgi:hypothetical protein